MSDEFVSVLKTFNQRLEDVELRCKVVTYALQGAMSQLNPDAEVAARRMANSAILAYCPEGQRLRRIAILEELFSNAHDRFGNESWLPPSNTKAL